MALIDFEQLDGFGWIRINRPEKRNAMNKAARDGLRAAMDGARNHCRALVLTGVDNIFCGGIDLKEVQAEASHGSKRALTDWRDLNACIREHPAIFIAAVNGLALGGGTTLTGVCDLAVASADAEFGMPEVGFGMYPNPAGPATQLSLTRKRAAWMVLTAQRISAATALEWGLINEVVPRSELDERAAAMAALVAQYNGATLSECKRALDQIPLATSNWRSAFEAGVTANANIEAQSGAAADGLARFSRGERNPGQGRGGS